MTLYSIVLLSTLELLNPGPGHWTIVTPRHCENVGHGDLQAVGGPGQGAGLPGCGDPAPPRHLDLQQQDFGQPGGPAGAERCRAESGGELPLLRHQQVRPGQHGGLSTGWSSPHLSQGSEHQIFIFKVIRGLRKENENLVPDVVKNIKETISLPCDFKVDERVEEETEFIWLKEDTKLDTENSKYSLLPNKSLLIQNITLEVRPYLLLLSVLTV